MKKILLLVLFFGLTPFATQSYAEQENVYAEWRSPSGLAAYNMDVRMKVLNTHNDTFFAQTFDFNNGGGGYLGLQQLGNGQRQLIFSIWKGGLKGQRSVVESWGKSANCQVDPGKENDGGVQCFKPYNWSTGKWYKLRIWRLSSWKWHDQWGAWIIDSAGRETHIGTITVKTKWRNEYVTVAKTRTFLEDFSDISECKDPAYTRLRIQAPSFNSNSSYAPYQSNNGGSRCTDKGGVYFTNRGRDLNLYMR